MISGMAGVTIWTDHLDSLVRFYRDILRLPLHSERDNFVAFRFGDVRLNLGLHSQVRGPSRDSYRVMINLGTKDIYSVYEHLVAHGVIVIRAPEQEQWGGWVATFLDPDGNILQLLQQPS